MKILLDECISRRLKKYLEAFEVYTVVELNLSGIKNGMLLKFCVENNFDILLTIDKNLIFQHNLDKYPLTIVVLNCHTSKIEDIVTFIPAFNSQVEKFQKHKAYVIDK